jgi:plastocyanin
MRRRSFPIAAVILTAAVGVTGPTPSQAVPTGSARDGSAPALRPATPLPDEVHVDVTDFRFTPATVALPRGGTIVFEHLGPSHHSATDATGMQLYDSGVVDPSSPPTSYTFAAAGVYPFVCTPHPFMGGRVNVPVRAAPATGPASERRTITWSTGPAPDGFVYDVQVHRPGTGWGAWRTGVATPSASFRTDAGTGRYRFRARLREPGVASSRWSQPATIRVG